MADKQCEVLVREYDEKRDAEVVWKLEKKCETGSEEGASFFSSIMRDPLCRVRFYPTHIMLVALLPENGELVGVVRGCIKCVGGSFTSTNVKIGCILGLRVSPSHRRLGIGLRLVKLIEEWAIRNGAEYTFLATEEDNRASRDLFTLKCNYDEFTSLVIFTQPNIKCSPTKKSHSSIEGVKIEKLQTDQAISLYQNRLPRHKEMYPIDIEAVLKEKPSLGTWVSCLKDEDWNGLVNGDGQTPSSWAVFSIWNISDNCKPFGFLFLYGLLGEGEKLGEMVASMWSFASRLAGNMKYCKAIMTELGMSDALTQHIPQGHSTCCIQDLWYFKQVSRPAREGGESMDMRQFGNVFVDPRDF